MQELYQTYQTRKNRILNSQYNYEEIWEHVFLENSNEPTMHKFLEQIDIQSPLNPADGFFGGRTECFSLYSKCRTKFEGFLKYLDVRSLYPSILKDTEKEMPALHPDIIVTGFSDNPTQDYWGYIKADILAPNDLWLPVLPQRIKTAGGEKLLFALCHTCAKNQTQTRCTHSQKQRSWVGTYTTVELSLAVENGYSILKLYEVWHWPVERRSGLLFRDFINTFLGYKIQASGFPMRCQTDDDKKQYVQEMNDHEGIDICVDEVEDNPGLRSLGKGIITNFWGKLAQNPDKIKVVYVTEPKDYFDKLLSEECEITNLNFVSDDMLEISYRTTEKLQTPQQFINLAIAGFVTSYARVELYKFASIVGTRLKYVDTDSLVFMSMPGLNDPPQGEFLGMLSDEIKEKHKVDDTIRTWVATGPKSYCYQLRKNRKIKCIKCKGFTLSSHASRTINFHSVRKMVKQILTEYKPDSLKVNYKHQIVRDRDTKTIFSKSMDKQYRVTFDKRVIVDLDHTLPYGHKDVLERS